MSQEILYTSAPQGLKPGSRGFCTVVSTSGMAKNLAERLEARSGYRHAYPAHDPRASLNPVNYSHLLLPVGGRKYHVLSRVCDAGLDYTKRSNKLAHHVALEPRELVPGGPAWVLAGEGFCETSWDGDPKILPGGRKPRTDNSPASVCHTWAKLTGDAGWAGALAKTALKPGSKPMTVIFKPGTDTLALVVEAIGLLPPDRRWDVTFSTYFTKSQSGVDCQWRFLVDGSPEAKAIRRNPHAPLIDLCRDLGQAEDGELVEAARTGKLPDSAVIKPGPAVAATRRIARREQAYDLPEQVESPDLFEQSATANSPERSPSRAAQAETSRLLKRQPAGRRKSQWLIVAVSSVVVFLLFGVMAGMFYLGTLNRQVSMNSPGDEASEEEDNHQNQPAEPKPTESEPNLDQPEEPTSDSPVPEDSEDPPAESEQPVDPEPAPDEPEQPEATEETPPEQPANDRDPLDDITLVKKNKLPLPRRNFKLGSSANKPKELAKVYVDSPQTCSLELVGMDRVLSGGYQFKTDVREEEGLRAWDIYRTAGKGQVGSRRTRLATFTLQDQSLKFQWQKVAQTARPALLQYCLLEVKAEDKLALCVLANPKEFKPVKMGFGKSSHLTEMTLDPDSVPLAKYLRVDLAFEGLPRHKPDTTLGLENKDTCTVSVFDPDAEGEEKTFLELEVHFELDGENRGLHLRTRAGPRYRGTSGQIAEKWDEITRDKLKNISKDWSPAKISRWRDEVRRSKRKITGYEREIEKINNLITGFREAKARLPAAPAPPSLDPHHPQRAVVNKAIEAAKQQRAVPEIEIAKLQEDNSKREGWIEVAEHNSRWQEKLSKLLGELEAKGRIKYRVYIEIEGTRVDVVRTEPAP